jgi:hypothetical protein
MQFLSTADSLSNVTRETRKVTLLRGLRQTEKQFKDFDPVGTKNGYVTWIKTLYGMTLYRESTVPSLFVMTFLLNYYIFKFQKKYLKWPFLF